MGIKTVAVYSTADKDSLHVKFADEAVCIGKPASASILILIFRISWRPLKLPMQMRIHPGYGFLGRECKICRKYVREHGIKFIGPNSGNDQ